MRNKIRIVAFMTFVFMLLFSISVFAVTEAEVQEAVNSSSKESVSGNLLVWFLCAIAFMKVSQKIDSFMGSLGISVGRTGGSMMAEAMIVARSLGSAAKMGGRFTPGSDGGIAGGVGARAAGVGGIFGGIGRKMANSAVSMATGGTPKGGLMASLGRRAYENSVGKGGSFAAGVISSVARGDISKMGSISGVNGKTAMESYFGYNASVNNETGQKTDSKSHSMTSLEHGGDMSIRSSSEMSAKMGVDVSGADGGNFDATTSDIGAQSYGDGAIPTFSDIEMGGGRITGFESTPDRPEPIEFAMYDAEKYAKPEGSFETVMAVDNSKWYKQYAVPTVEKTPYMDSGGRVQYNEKIVNRIPKAPMRKDRM